MLSRNIRLRRKVSGGTETSKYLEESKSTEIPLVVANERGIAQTVRPIRVRAQSPDGVVGSKSGAPFSSLRVTNCSFSRTDWNVWPKKVKAL